MPKKVNSLKAIEMGTFSLKHIIVAILAPTFKK